MHIQLAVEDDADIISSLILETASKQLRAEFSDDGWDLFLNLLNVDTQRALIKNNKFNYLLAIQNAESQDKKALTGLLAIKGKSHLFHFFVAAQWQGKGVGKLLWDRCLEDISIDRKSSSKFKKKIKKITVNSSDFAIEFYLKLGFKMVSGRHMKNGICYTPMIYSLADQSE